MKLIVHMAMLLLMGKKIYSSMKDIQENEQKIMDEWKQDIAREEEKDIVQDREGDSKEQKRLLKAQKKAEKLAKLEAKKDIQPVISKKPKKPTSNGYDPIEIEKYWTEYWAKNQSFLPKESSDGKKFVMVIPPPNITGSLHIGHAMMISIEDCIVRYKRLTGHEVLYLPGLDHAGIATQTVVLKNMKGAITSHSIANDKTSDRNIGVEIDRDSFMKAAFEWSEKYGNRIYEQFNRMGASLDYSRKVFTLDPKVSKSVNTAFCTLYNKGLIYRDNKIVNWCGRLKTTVSDLEVNYKNIEGGTYVEADEGKYKFGVLYYIKYYLTRDTGFNGSADVERNSGEYNTMPYVVIATTRPETILGDSAICINPKDPRFDDIDSIFTNGKVLDLFNENYNKLPHGSKQSRDNSLNNVENEEAKAEKKNKYKINKEREDNPIERKEKLFAINPLTNEIIPVIFDSQADLNFETGILKVTPCHDPVDFRLGKKHNLAFNRILNESNSVSHSMYLNMKRFEARKTIIEDLKKAGMFVKEENHDQVLPFCSRSNDIIESAMKEQWWCNCKGMAQKALDGVKNNEIEVFPVEAKDIWVRWLENIKDWCLSRQLWWGHRIPAYKGIDSNGDEQWIVAETQETASEIAKDKGYKNIQQDSDVLDTWFSSGLWPFSTLGWPDKTVDFGRYFPNSLLETGSDILFFWVARMVMLSYELMGTRPFDRIFLHGIVRDAHGRKMSKSLGNVIDPLYVIEGIDLESMINNLKIGNLDQREIRRAIDALKKDYPNGIPKCGADSLRFTLLSYTNGMKDINLDILRVQGYSRLCNKIWNAYKFISNIKLSDPLLTNSAKLSDTLLPDISNISLSDPLLPNSTKLSDCILLSKSTTRPFTVNINSLKDHQKWILNRLNKTIVEQHKFIEEYNFMAASQSIYQLFFDFCDNIIEVSKNASVEDNLLLKYVFTSIMKLLNPFMPFITEEIHHALCSTIITDYPQIIPGDYSNSFDDVLNIAKICRSNEKVAIENGSYISYIKCLVKGELNVVDKLDDFKTVGNINYKILQ